MVIKSIVLCITLISVVQAEDRHSETDAVNQFPHNITVEYNNEQLDLFLTGLTIRKKFFLKIYSMAHYIEQKPDDSGLDVSGNKIYSNILHHNNTKQISMVFLRELTAEQIQKSLISGIKLNTNKEEYLQILPQVEEFTHAIYENVKQNDEFILRWFPDGTIVSIFQDEEISSIKNDKFARALWSIWFGNHSVVDRESLIKKLITNS